MNVLVTARHYVDGSEGSLKTLRKATDDLIYASTFESDIKYGLRVSYRPDLNGDGTVQKALDECSKKLRENEIRFLQELTISPSISLLQAAFDAGYCLDSVEPPIVFVLDPDVFSLCDEKVRNSIKCLSEIMYDSGATFGSVARDSVNLGEGVLGDMREIHELVIIRHTGQLGWINTKNPLDLNISEVPKGYKRWGDLYTGLRAYNHGGTSFGDLYKAVIKNSRANWVGHSAEYYIPTEVAAEGVGLIPCVYGPSSRDHPVITEREKVRKLIREHTLPLFSTDLCGGLIDTIDDPETKKEIVDCGYSKELVQEVLDLMAGKAS